MDALAGEVRDGGTAGIALPTYTHQADGRLLFQGPQTLEALAAALGEALQGRLRARESLADPDAVKAYLQARVALLPYEVFGCVFLDAGRRVMAVEELFRGTLTGAAVYPREIIRHCIAHNGAYVIAFHNHPSGHSEPSAADEMITDQIKKALAAIDVKLIDHLVVGATVTSMAQRGML